MSNFLPRLWKWPFAPMIVTGSGLFMLQLPEYSGVGFDWHTRTDCLVAKIVPISNFTLSCGRCQKLIRTFADCLEKGRWPAYGDDVRVIGLPDFYRKRLNFEDEAGLLPEDYSHEAA